MGGFLFRRNFVLVIIAVTYVAGVGVFFRLPAHGGLLVVTSSRCPHCYSTSPCCMCRRQGCEVRQCKG